jgi:hypothetical protein
LSPNAKRANTAAVVAVVALVVAVALVGLSSVHPGTPGAALRAAGSRTAVRISPSLAPNPFTMGMAASLAIGQPNLTSGVPGHNASNLTGPSAAIFGPSGELFVVDSTNDRVLGYDPPLSTGMAASIAIGQVSLTVHVAATTQTGLWEPAGLTFNAAGDLFVADAENSRVLEYLPPFTTGMAASLVLGQAVYTTRTPATGPAGLDLPTGLAFTAAGDLLVADRGNNRIVEYVPPFTNGMAASLVLGQSSFLGSTPATTAVNLSFPDGLAIGAGGALFVADTGNSRVLEFVPPFASGMAASLVLGEKNFTLTGEALPYGMTAPWGVTFDRSGDLWVADAGTPNRVSEFLPPFATNQLATIAIGQTSLTGTSTGTTATTLYAPEGATFDPAGDLWVVDTENSRVLEYVPTTVVIGFAETGLATGTSWSVTYAGVQVTTSGSWISFYSNNGVYGWSAGSVSGYSVSPGSGTLTVNGSNQSVAIAYTPTILGLPPSTFWPVLAVILLLVILAEAVLLARKRRRRAQPPAPLTPASSTPPTPPPESPG